MATVEDAGARWIVPSPVPEFEYTAYTVSGGDTIGVGLTNHYVVFEDTSKLKIEFQVIKSTGTWEYGEYSYHFTSPQGFVFRYDKHPERWFEQQHGTDCHVHDGHPKSKKHMFPTPIVELDFVIDRVIHYQHTGEFVRA